VNEAVESGKERERVANAIEGWVSERAGKEKRGVGVGVGVGVDDGGSGGGGSGGGTDSYT